MFTKGQLVGPRLFQDVQVFIIRVLTTWKDTNMVGFNDELTKYCPKNPFGLFVRMECGFTLVRPGYVSVGHIDHVRRLVKNKTTMPPVGH
jgi:hypothetical protein